MISNFTDFDALSLEEGVKVSTSEPEELNAPPSFCPDQETCRTSYG
jgi:cobyric acid synthase